MMRKFIAILTCLYLLLAPGAALAQSAGNLNNGGFVETDGASLYVARADGIFRMDASGRQAVQIAPARASHLQRYDGWLYYLAGTYEVDEYGYEALVAQSPMRCLPDGTQSQALGAARVVGQAIAYPAREGDEVIADTYVGYAGFSVGEEGIFFLGNAGEAGSYVVGERHADETGAQVEITITVRYTDGIALHRMAPDGTGEEVLTPTLGNAVAHLAVEGARVYAASGYLDAIYAYHYVNYHIFGPDGAPLAAFENAVEDDWGLFSEAGQFYHLPLAVLPDGDGLLVSLADSEGDFIASRLVRLAPDGQMTQIAIEQGFIPSLLAGETLYYVGSASQDVFYDEAFDYEASLGIYAKAPAEAGPGTKLAALPFDGYLDGFSMNVLGEHLYFMGADRVLYRAALAGEGLERWTEAGFVRAQIDFVPEEYGH